MKKIFPLFAILFSIACNAQTSGGGALDDKTPNEINTISGVLSIVAVGIPGKDDVTFDVRLNGKNFDDLSGSQYSYVLEDPVKGSGKLVHRILMEDFIGGASTPPSVSIYDFRGRYASITQLNEIDFGEVRWIENGVLLNVNGRWRKFLEDKHKK